MKGTSQGIMISSDPTGAEVAVDGMSRGRKPIDVAMKRKRDHLVSISLDGYETRTIPVIKDVGGAVWGNVLMGGLIGWGVDATSGAQYNLNPPTIHVKLTKSNSLTSSENSSLSSSNFVSELNVLDDLKDRGKLTDDEYVKLRFALFKKYYPEAELNETSE